MRGLLAQVREVGTAGKKRFRIFLLLLVEFAIIWSFIAPLLPGAFPFLAGNAPGFPLDDSWIYAVFARNFVSGGETAFNPGRPSIGFTSTLWFLLLSLGRSFGFSVVGWSIFLGCAAQFSLAAMTGLLVYRFLLSAGEVFYPDQRGAIVGGVSNPDQRGVIVGGVSNPDPAGPGIGPGLSSLGAGRLWERFVTSIRGKPGIGLGRYALCSMPYAPCSMPYAPYAMLPHLLAFFISLLVLLCGPLIWYSLSGMETTAFLAIGVFAIFCLSRGRYRWAGGALGFLLITRIEGIVLWGIALVYAAIIESRRDASGEAGRPDVGGAPKIFRGKFLTCPDSICRGPDPRQHVGGIGLEKPSHSGQKTGPGRSAPGALRSAPGALRSALCALRPILPLLLIPALFLILELLKNLCVSGSLLPTTFSGRKWLSVPAGGRGPLAYLRLWGYGLTISLLPPAFQQGPLLAVFWGGAGLLALCSLRLILQNARKGRRRISGLFLLLLWAAGHNLVYIVMLPSPSQAGRYQAINFLLFWIMLFLPAACWLVRAAGPGGGRIRARPGVLPTVLLAAIILLDLGSTLKWRKVYSSSVRHINDVHVAVARRIDRELPEQSRLAAFDIGALKYFSPRTEVIDLGGLVDRDFAGYLREGRVVDYLKERGAAYLAMVELQTTPGWIFENLGILGDPRLGLRPLFGMMQRPEIYRVHYREVANTFPKMVVYEIQWSDGVVE
ncbi:MAG: hypothetical protein V1789_06080 [PVC group bacterium]